MKPSGHHKVAKEAGLPLLMEAFGGDHRALGAFYLGNWIADYSQLVEPVAMENLRNKFTAPDNREDIVDRVWPDNHPAKQLIGLYGDAVSDIFKWIYTDEELERCEETGEIPLAIYDILMSPERMSGFLQEQADLAERINGAFDALFQGQEDTRDSVIGLMMREIFFLIGYFQFVFEPENTPEPDPLILTMDEFKAVFGEPDQTSGTRTVAGQPHGGIAAPASPGAFTQYYPHEHYDRPTIPEGDNIQAPGKQELYRPFRLGNTPAQRTRSGFQSETLPPGPRAVTSTDDVPRAGNHQGAVGVKEVGAPDIYSYLRDYMEGTAGLLAELDDAFAEALAAPPVAAGKDGSFDPDWVRTLAKAGHTLHQVEDFFAHSNYVELAVKQLGLEERYFPPKTTRADANFARTVYARRLKRFVNYADGKEPDKREDEEWVVTGYFDVWDTIIAIMHTLQAHQDSWGSDDPYVTRHESRKDPLTQAQAQETWASSLKKPAKDSVRAMLEMYWVLTDWEKALSDPDNEVAGVIREKFPQIGKDLKEGIKPFLTEKDVKDITAVLPIMEHANPEVVRALANIYILGGNLGTAKTAGTSVLDALSLIEKMMFNPVGLIAGELLDTLGSNTRLAVQRRIFDLVGADRIGCHSLLAKDHLDATLYKPMWYCSAAVHSHIMKVLVRDRRNDPDGDAVDWLELLEAMLRNPATPQDDGPAVTQERESFETITHKAKRGEQIDSLSQPALSLTRRYAWTSEQGRYRSYNATEPADGYHWRMIADATFGTIGMSDTRARGVINSRLRSMGAPRVGANYALKPGMELKIPHQRVVRLVEDVSRPVKPWWEVLLEPDKLDLNRVASRRGEPSKMGHVPTFFAREDFDKLIVRGKYLREVFREFYRPRKGPGGADHVATPRHSGWPRKD